MKDITFFSLHFMVTQYTKYSKKCNIRKEKLNLGKYFVLVDRVEKYSTICARVCMYKDRVENEIFFFSNSCSSILPVANEEIQQKTEREN